MELNRAVALAMASGPTAGLALVDRLVDDPALAGYHLLPSVRGDLLARLGRHAEARVELLRAAELTENERERALLRERAEAAGRAAAEAEVETAVPDADGTEAGPDRTPARAGQETTTRRR